MKLLITFAAVFLTGCAQIQMAFRPKSIRGETCLESPRMKVFQVLDGGILAYICPADYPSYDHDGFESCMFRGDLVYISVAPKANDYVDNQKVTLTKSQCFVGDGTFRYKRNDGDIATVRNVKIVEEESKSADAGKKAP